MGNESVQPSEPYFEAAASQPLVVDTDVTQVEALNNDMAQPEMVEADDRPDGVSTENNPPETEAKPAQAERSAVDRLGPVLGSVEVSYIPTKRKGGDVKFDEEGLTTYLDQIGRYELLDKEGEARLGKRVLEGQQAAERLVREGDELSPTERVKFKRAVRSGEAAEEEFIQKNLRLVVSVAKRYQNTGIPLLDLIQEGNIGLMRAVKKFDYRKGFKFSTYATYWIRQTCQRSVFSNGRAGNLTGPALADMNSMEAARKYLEVELGREPTVDEMADHMAWEMEKFEDALRAGEFLHGVLSIHEPIADDGTQRQDLMRGPDEETSLIYHPDEAVMAQAGAREILTELLRDEPYREKKLFLQRYLLGMSLQDLGTQAGFSSEWARKRIQETMARVRERALQSQYGEAGLAVGNIVAFKHTGEAFKDATQALFNELMGDAAAPNEAPKRKSA